MSLTAKYTNHANERSPTTGGPVASQPCVRVFRVFRGSQEGAGGIGGLLARSAHAGTYATNHTHACYHADGNGSPREMNAASGLRTTYRQRNHPRPRDSTTLSHGEIITYLVNSSQTVAASYRYDPYGNTISSSGGLASANVYRFSSKEFLPTWGLYYYGHRFYAPNLQRWLNRDPLGEPDFELLRQAGEDIGLPGPNLYAFVRNDPVKQFDPLGLKEKREKSYWDWVKEMADKVKQAAKDYEHGKCPKDPCKFPSSLNGLCTCMYEAAKNKSVEDMIQCVCMTSPDSECEKKARKAIESVYGSK